MIIGTFFVSLCLSSHAFVLISPISFDVRIRDLHMRDTPMLGVQALWPCLVEGKKGFPLYVWWCLNN